MKDVIDFRTSRVLFKAITPKLIADLLSQKSEDEVIAFFETDKKGYDHFKNMYENGIETFRISFHYFLLLDRETNSIIGECGFHTLNKTHHRAELFYNLKNESDRRKGLMSEALPEVLNFGFNQLQLHRIEALTASWNDASIKLLEKFHFTKEGIMREDYIVDGKFESSECYSLLEWEWKTFLKKQ